MPDGEHPAPGRLVQAAQQVLRVAAGGQRRPRCRPGRPNAAIWRANTTSTPMSLHSAVTTAVSLARQNAGSGAHAVTGVEEQRGQFLRVGGAAAVAEGQQPPAGREPGGHVLGAGPQPGRVAGADLAPQLGDLGGLGHGGRADLLQHRVQVGSVPGVQERVQRLHRGRAGAAGRAAGLPPRSDAAGGHDVTTAIASPACTRMVSPGRGADERDADLFLAGAGVHHGQVVGEQPHDGHRRRRCRSR